METSQLICSTNQLTGFHMMGALVVDGLKQIVSQMFLEKTKNMKRLSCIRLSGSFISCIFLTCIIMFILFYIQGLICNF